MLGRITAIFFLLGAVEMARAEERDGIEVFEFDQHPSEIGQADEATSDPITGSIRDVNDSLALINIVEVRSSNPLRWDDPEFFPLRGEGMTVAVIDSGLNVDHADFAGKVRHRVDLTQRNPDGSIKVDEGQETDVEDMTGHGTHVAGIICARSDYRSVAPDASIIPIRVSTSKTFRWDPIIKALEWVKDNHEEHGISVVNLSINDERLHVDIDYTRAATYDRVRVAIGDLSTRNIPVIVAAGNMYHRQNNAHTSQANSAILGELRRCKAGLAFPAIVKQSISVGAVYARTERNPVSHPAHLGLVTKSTVPGQIVPFTHRLHDAFISEHACFSRADPSLRTDGIDVFAPSGFREPSTGTQNSGLTRQDVDGGTSWAAAYVSGVALLLQEIHKKASPDSSMPSSAKLVVALRHGVEIMDGDDEHDDVRHSCATYQLVNAPRAVDTMLKFADGLMDNPRFD